MDNSHYAERAYNLLPAQVKGGPDWIDREPYYVDARAENPEAGPEQIRAMLQTLLTDRFKLAVHRETRQGQVYTLVAGKNGSKLQDAKDGTRNYINWTDPGEVTFTGDYNMLGLIGLLSSLLNAPVLDKTNLRGSHNFRLEFIPPRFQSLKEDDSQPEPKSPAKPQHPNPFTGRPDLFTALQEQLGLQLQAAKGPVEVLVIDNIERPSPN